jgi:lantibiotic leader peptide-processing serine protease
MKLRSALPALVVAGSLAFGACTDESLQPLSPDALSLSESAETGDFAVEVDGSTGRHLVVVGGQKLPRTFTLRVAALGGTVEASYGSIGVAVVRGLTPEAAAQLQMADDVEIVDEDQVLDFVDAVEVGGAVLADVESRPSPTGATFFPRQWHLRAIGADQAWAAGYRGSENVKVAILDTGIDYTYPDLAGRVDLGLSRDFVTWTTIDQQLRNLAFPTLHPILDLHGHGTHVGSTVVSNGIVNAGVTQNVTLIGVKVLSARGSGSSADILGGIMYAADAGADVINMSLGGTFRKSANPGFVAVINRAITYANRKGVVVVVSAGNSRLDMDHDGDSYKTYCSAPTVVCVSATGPGAMAGVNGPWTDIDTPAYYTNFGRSAVDVSAPGGNYVINALGQAVSTGAVWAACSKQRLTEVAPGQWAYHTCSANPLSNFTVGMHGTSMASPHVSGLAALLVERHGKNPGRVRQILHQSADKLGDSGNDPYHGKGRINIPRALGL